MNSSRNQVKMFLLEEKTVGSKYLILEYAYQNFTTVEQKLV